MPDAALRFADPTLVRDRCLIDGAWVAAEGGATIAVTNPATGAEIARVPRLARGEVAGAIAAAHRAWAPWRATLAKERAKILRRWHDLMLANQEDLARLMTLEQGKPLKESRGEIAYAASFLDWAAGDAERTFGDVIPTHGADRRVLALREPIGVCAAITPWNFPAAMITRKAGPALAVGCTMVVKPASATPLSALALGELALRAGVPPGVLSVVTGAAGEVGAELAENPLVRKITFTGSTEIGKRLMAQAAGTVKKVALELGGNAPFLVFDDADLEAAAEGAIISKFRNAGQTCVCANRIFVQEGVYDRFAALFAAKVAALRVGDGLAEGVEIGPLIDGAGVQKVEAHLADATGKGARVLVGGGRHEAGEQFFQPTVLADVTPAMVVMKEETFGPLAPLFRFKDEAEAIRLANDTEFGLAAYLYSRDLGRIFRVTEGLEYGIVGVNTGLISTASAPFGGYKESGLGREGSRVGTEEYLETKYVCLAGI